jgi:hypothetical protein
MKRRKKNSIDKIEFYIIIGLIVFINIALFAFLKQPSNSYSFLNKKTSKSIKDLNNSKSSSLHHYLPKESDFKIKTSVGIDDLLVQASFKEKKSSTAPDKAPFKPTSSILIDTSDPPAIIKIDPASKSFETPLKKEEKSFKEDAIKKIIRENKNDSKKNNVPIIAYKGDLPSYQSVGKKNKNDNSSIESDKKNVEYQRNGGAYIAARHIEGRGLGSVKGYTTFEGQLYSNVFNNTMSGFIDLRLHFFNNGTYASNTGVGWRYFSESSQTVYGLNVYYDTRKISNQPLFNQVSFAFEWLGYIDCRFMVNIPIENKKEFVGSTQKNYDGGYFLITKKYKQALSSIFFEFGHMLEESEKISVYGAVSQYYLKLSDCDQAFGGKTRLRIGIYDFLSLEGIATYDTYFKAKGQMSIGLFYTWGESKSKKSKKKSRDNLFKYSYHNEIIPLGNKNEFSYNW